MRVLETEEDLRWLAGGGDNTGSELAGGGDSTGFGVGRRWRLEDLGWPAAVEIGGYG